MGLKQDIVVVNQFSTKTASGGGTRGGTPGSYVMRYMARTGATEDMAPVRLEDNDVFIYKYMARKEATERLDSLPRLKRAMDDVKGLGGVAFGCTGRYDEGDVSMSDRKIRKVSKDIQKYFEDGKTVLKTVVSFDTDYLRRVGVIPKDFEPEVRGDFRGNIDQMKLRVAMMDGMKKLGRRFDDLEWCGVVQVDTMHVHCHLCMVDKGEGRLNDKGFQRGKLFESDKRALRRGIDMSLDEMQPIKMLSSGVAYDRRNARCFIKKFTHEVMANRSLPQFLIACLPDDRNLWRASTHRKEMQKPNAIVREYVEEVLALPDSGYDKALRDIESYAKERAGREDLTGQEYRQLLRNGRERLIDDCMNGVYAVLKDIPRDELRTRTPMLDVMSMEYTQMANEAVSDPMIEFGFKLRSYSSRLNHHKKERSKYREAVKTYDEAKEQNQVAPESAALRNFYFIEEEYNAKLMSKYQHFLAFLPPEESYKESFDELMDYRHKVNQMRSMVSDRSMRRRSPESAEEYGRRVYELSGGRFAVTEPSVLTGRLEDMMRSYASKVDDFKAEIAGDGLSFDERQMEIKKRPAHEFNEVKALDLHHLSYDFPYDVDVSLVNINAFVDMANRRYDAYMGAEAYLKGTGQEDHLQDLPGKDVRLMKEMADSLSVTHTVKTMKQAPTGRQRGVRTVSLDKDFMADMKLAVRTAVASVDYTG